MVDAWLLQHGHTDALLALQQGLLQMEVRRHLTCCVPAWWCLLFLLGAPKLLPPTYRRHNAMCAFIPEVADGGFRQ